MRMLIWRKTEKGLLSKSASLFSSRFFSSLVMEYTQKVALFNNLWADQIDGIENSNIDMDLSTFIFCYGNSRFSRDSQGKPGMAWLFLGLWNKRDWSWFPLNDIISWAGHLTPFIYSFEEQLFTVTFLVTDSNGLWLGPLLLLFIKLLCNAQWYYLITLWLFLVIHSYPSL